MTASMICGCWVTLALIIALSLSVSFILVYK